MRKILQLKDEYIITRHSKFQKPINVINCYGEIESRSSKNDIEERWQRLLEKIVRIEASNESVILIGDLNKFWWEVDPPITGWWEVHTG